jgi:hypothetical protein
VTFTKIRSYRKKFSNSDSVEQKKHVNENSESSIIPIRSCYIVRIFFNMEQDNNVSPVTLGLSRAGAILKGDRFRIILIAFSFYNTYVLSLP